MAEIPILQQWLSLSDPGSSCQGQEMKKKLNRRRRTLVYPPTGTPHLSHLPDHSPSHQMVDTRKSNATKHPGMLVAEAKQQRWTRKQMEKDKARTKAAAIAAKEQASAEHRAIITQVADIMDSVARVEEEIQAHTNRPDLRNFSKLKHPTVTQEITDLE